MILKKSQKIAIGISILILLVLIGILIWNYYYKKADTPAIIINPSQCPKWINCELHEGINTCEIPKGCEGITQTAE